MRVSLATLRMPPLALLLAWGLAHGAWVTFITAALLAAWDEIPVFILWPFGAMLPFAVVARFVDFYERMLMHARWHESMLSKIFVLYLSIFAAGIAGAALVCMPSLIEPYQWACQGALAAAACLVAHAVAAVWRVHRNDELDKQRVLVCD